MRNIGWITIIATIIVSCSNDNFNIEGTITNSESQMIYLERLGISGTTSFDSSKIDAKGNFSLRGSVSYPSFFLLKLNDQKFITLLIDSLEDIRFSADYINFSKEYAIEGSLGSKKVKALSNRLTRTNTELDSIKSLIALCVSNEHYLEQKEGWITEIKTILSDQQEFSKKFIDENPFSLASVLAVYQKFNDGSYVLQDLQTLKMAASALYAMYPKSVHVQSLYKDTEKLVKGIQNQKIQSIIEKYGANTPNIVLPDREGKKVALQPIKGKCVLVQFWSSSDKTSRVMNEVLRENYKKFNVKGFDIYQVSVDTDRKAWEKAILDDHLSWTNVGDMEGSSNAVTSFNILQIPYNYLLDSDGKIIAKGLKGPALYNKLSEILN